MFHIFDLFNNSWKFPFNLAQILEFHRWANHRLKHSNFSFCLKRNSGFEFHERYFCVQSLGFLHSINCCLLLTESHHNNHISVCYLINFILWLCVHRKSEGQIHRTANGIDFIRNDWSFCSPPPPSTSSSSKSNTENQATHNNPRGEKFIYENSIFIPPSIAANDNKLFNISRASQID